jgi:hypothetical protein
MSTFLQVLEGDPEVIDELYLKINSDDRHSNIHCISRTSITERNFPNWKMGFRNLSNTPASNLEGFSDFLDTENSNDSLLNSPSVVENMLLHFKNKTHEIRL